MRLLFVLVNSGGSGGRRPSYCVSCLLTHFDHHNHDPTTFGQCAVNLGDGGESDGDARLHADVIRNPLADFSCHEPFLERPELQWTSDGDVDGITYAGMAT